MAKISIIGAGSWGTALGLLLCDNGHEVTVCSENKEEVRMLAENHEHQTKLPGVLLPEQMKFTSDMEAALSGRDVLVMAKASPYVRSTAKKYAEVIPDGQLIVNVAKGVEENTLMTMSQIIETEIPTANVAVLSGPSHAEEVGRRLPTTIVVGAQKKETALYVQNLFMNPVFRVYTSPDITGIELGGSLKNVIALAAGIADGLGYGDNTKAALITRGIAEITRLGIAMGAHAETFYGLSGIGDLIVTCASVHSRNRKAGYLIGKGYTMEQAMKEVRMIVEGVYSAKAGLTLSEKYGIETPIIKAVNEVLFQEKKPKDAVDELMQRMKKDELAPDLWG
ncbi:MAG: NAD(P)H-dependent glycerol-3-phosphate dehydrogenase [Fusicatenibacter sp.]|nr:NAD(P)H-dependent glycerol-3-phosphate dehydrogenase [Lachnospiraceae bacterium]MDY2936796.1 NAD(P)H-dependent glycerol-3-phosphate dehydrogenase [Fusicatenibacter sp.]